MHACHLTSIVQGKAIAYTIAEDREAYQKRTTVKDISMEANYNRHCFTVRDNRLSLQAHLLWVYVPKWYHIVGFKLILYTREGNEYLNICVLLNNYKRLNLSNLWNTLYSI